MLKKSLSITFITIFLVSTSANAQSEAIITKNGKTYTINTTSICNSKGYRSTTPLKVSITKNVIDKIEALPNKETPGFFAKIIKELFPKYEGVKITETEKIDVISGATLSSKAVKENIEAAVEYYKKNK
ncbi:MAG: FMN-binding protein [Prevotellaceae bacterium]|nr:FMN-binding protein [Candidatus Colivivens equi]